MPTRPVAAEGPVHRIWDDKIGHPIFRATMSKMRFVFLASSLCMDDSSTRDDRWQTDRFAAAREFWNLFIDACSRSVQADDFVTIDETLYRLASSSITAVNLLNTDC